MRELLLAPAGGRLRLIDDGGLPELEEHVVAATADVVYLVAAGDVVALAVIGDAEPDSPGRFERRQKVLHHPDFRAAPRPGRERDSPPVAMNA